MKVKSVINGILLTVTLMCGLQVTAMNESLSNNKLFAEVQAALPPKEVPCVALPERFQKFTTNVKAISIEQLLREIIVPLEDSLKAKVIVTSGYRSHSHNRRVGGVPNSFHTKGRAIDLVVPNGNNKEIVAIIKSINPNLEEIIDEGNHIHIAI